jgi:hypothetical protein
MTWGKNANPMLRHWRLVRTLPQGGVDPCVSPQMMQPKDPCIDPDRDIFRRQITLEEQPSSLTQLLECISHGLGERVAK